ncbi:hypothetical protein [Fundidesulfovibrio putealis]|uniref:hypothetical protein n=1 Tax=Fundidesulfovibrio putealis TaxID=270496 RepID=UPI0012EBA683|nr:hypothetical protein [Fundidesulfovibrio putealis]
MNELSTEMGFWEAVGTGWFLKTQWLEAVRLALPDNEDFLTVLSLRECLQEVRSMPESDPTLEGCFQRHRKSHEKYCYQYIYQA